MPVVATPHQRASIVTTLKAVRSPRRQALQQGRLQRRISVSLTRGASPTGRYNRGVVESSLANAHFIVSWRSVSMDKLRTLSSPKQAFRLDCPLYGSGLTAV